MHFLTNKKDFLTNQCKEIEESNRMGRTRELFKKISHTKGMFCAKMGTIKERNRLQGKHSDTLMIRKSHAFISLSSFLPGPDNEVIISPQIRPCYLQVSESSL